jgi:sterol desaturase/sphingolipid hydroxylase (fatty acid hydroxylase superfamily)
MPAPSQSAFISTMICFFAGNIIWTILEYTLHRFLFHVDHYLPEKNWAMLLHFLLHGIHHYLPMDQLRLVMPPTLFLALETPFTNLAHLIFPKAIANGIIAGAFTFYILYDCMHFALHHTRLPQYMAEMKRYHLAHHYKSESCPSMTKKKANNQTSSWALESPQRSGIMSSTLSYLSLPNRCIHHPCIPSSSQYSTNMSIIIQIQLPLE